MGWIDDNGCQHEFEYDDDDVRESEYVASFEPDFDLSETGLVETASWLQSETDSPDIQAFDRVSQQMRSVFLERRGQYGNHIDKAQRFPKYFLSALYAKCVRVITAMDRGDDPDTDTLIDMGCYCDMILSTKDVE